MMGHQRNQYLRKLGQMQRLIMYGHISEVMNNNYSLIIRFTMQQIGIEEFLTTNYLMRQYHSQYMVGHLEM